MIKDLNIWNDIPYLLNEGYNTTQKIVLAILDQATISQVSKKPKHMNTNEKQIHCIASKFDFYVLKDTIEKAK